MRPMSPEMMATVLAAILETIDDGPLPGGNFTPLVFDFDFDLDDPSSEAMRNPTMTTASTIKHAAIRNPMTSAPSEALKSSNAVT